MKRSELKEGMKVAIGKRDRHGMIELRDYHVHYDGEAVVKDLKSGLVVEITADFPVVGPNLTVKKGPRSTMRFSMNGRDILGPWESIYAEYCEQQSAKDEDRQLRSDLQDELNRLKLDGDVLCGDLTISQSSFQSLLKILKSVP